MKLKKIIQNFPIKLYRGPTDIEITGLCAHSKLIAPGNLFIAKKGNSEEGSKYIEEAILSGAVAILTDMPNPFLKRVTQLLHPTPHLIEAKLAARFYGSPSEILYTVGVTGTNGKTTTTFLIKHLFDQLGFSCGLMGTIKYIIGTYQFEAERTTPDSITCQKFFKEMVKFNCSSAVMEVSSHGLSQGRCDEIQFDAAIFTNLSQDHLDYHVTMEKYAEEKAKLFSRLTRDQWAIINAESPWSSFMVQKCEAHIFTYGFLPTCDLFADEIFLHPTETEFSVHYRNESARFTCALIGRYNILNCLAAIAACLVRGVHLRNLPPLLENFTMVPGRLQKIENLKGLNLFIDYAHTPDALEQVLSCLREITQGKIITVFGCGGDRDRGKRPKMGKAAEQGSDFTIVTSDNPRSENPETICSEIVMGFSNSHFTVITDRRQAIATAIEMATSKDLILIAGKGHETYQLFAHRSVPFDDGKIAQEIANNSP